MPHSLKSKIKSLCYKGEITEKERDKIIHALEKQPGEDCISRLIVQEEITKSITLKENPHQMYKRIQAIPSVTPQQPCEEENPNCTECRYYDKEKHHCPRFCKVIENTMAEITSEQPGWIPVSKELPPIAQRVWVSATNGEVFIARYHSFDKWTFEPTGISYAYNKDSIVAWMPLPQPYAESEDKE